MDAIGVKDWKVSIHDFEPHKLHHMETLFTIGNGYLSTRGAFDEGFPGDKRATFIHGVFDTAPIVFTELANAPDWLPLTVFLNGERFAMDRGKAESFEQTLDMSNGTLIRVVRWRALSGATATFRFQRFTSLATPHLLCMRCEITPDYEGEVDVRAGLQGCTENEGLAHWQWICQGREGEAVYLVNETRQSRIRIANAMKVSVSAGNEEKREFWNAENSPVLALNLAAVTGRKIIVDKFVAVATSRDTDNPLSLALEHLNNVVDWQTSLEANCRAWEEEWARTDVLIEGDEEAQLALRFNLFQLLIAAPRHDDRVNIGAKTLSGFGYRGHSFWDTEIFMLPLFTFTAPHIAKNLLNYRHQRLPGARQKAQANGYKGAQFPWESADTGEEVTPTWVQNPNDRTRLIRIWTGDIEIHISSDIAYASYIYWKTTGDDDWFIEKGAELVLDTAKFWASRAEWNVDRNSYEYNDVIGPDEYHDHVNNNFYTNYMARWNLKTALEILAWLNAQAPAKAKELSTNLELTPDLLAFWQDVIARIYLPVQPDGLIEQFEGYFQCNDINLAALEPREISAQVYFGIEGCCQTQVLKQPDVLMLLYLMRDEFDQPQVRVNYDYYTPRTDLTFGSSLGPSIQAIISCRLGDSQTAYEYFMRAARADLKDVRGNASDGIHGASAGGIWQAIIFGFAGLHLSTDRWEIQPCLPAHWKRLSFHFVHHGQLQTVDIQNP